MFFTHFYSAVTAEEGKAFQQWPIPQHFDAPIARKKSEVSVLREESPVGKGTVLPKAGECLRVELSSARCIESCSLLLSSLFPACEDLGLLSVGGISTPCRTGFSRVAIFYIICHI